MRGGSKQVLELYPRFREVKCSQLDLREVGQPTNISQPSMQGVALPQLAPTQSEQDCKSSLSRACEHVHQDVQCARVRPLKVVHYQNHRLAQALRCEPIVKQDRRVGQWLAAR